MQLDNAALAIGATEAVLGEEIPRSVLTASLSKTQLLGRQQIGKEDIETIFDVAHNPSAARVLAHSLGSENDKPGSVALLGMYTDKDIKGFVKELAEVVVSWHVMPIQGVRAERPQNIGEILHDAIPGGVIIVHEDPDLAIIAARQDAITRGRNLLVTGSFETVGAVLASRIYCSQDAGSG